ncbi:MAG: sigma-54 interaction domain-containing protein, partial [Thermodesulfobacteriota bacterium]
LILGETGSGKELLARAIHSGSPGRDRPMVKVNCAVLPANLIESELFGHEKGAFTGAHTRQAGRFEVANGTTLFLDEIGELPLELQAKLLRVIEHGEFERLGSTRTIKVDVRVISATNRNLEEEVRKGRFREDLWYRLSVFPITVPPLRERQEDIPLLVQSFVSRIQKRIGREIRTIPKKTMEALQEYPWPGNVRELENVVERAVISSTGSSLRLADRLESPEKGKTKKSAMKTLEQVEREHILQVLEETNWRISGEKGAARILGLHHNTLRGRMKKLGIRPPWT